MKKKLVIIMLLTVNLVTSQTENIELPNDYGYNIKYSNNGITPLLNIYINQNGDVNLEKIRIPITQLGDSLVEYRKKIRPDLVPWLITSIYADKNTPYLNVEKVKSQMSNANLLKAVYRTGQIDHINKGITVRLNSKSLTQKEKITERNNLNSLINNQLVIIKDPIFKMVDNLYDLKFEKALEILKSYKYKKVVFYNNKKLKINGKKYKFKDKEKIYKKLKNTNFILTYTFPYITYDTYLKNISSLADIYKENKKNTSFIEISSDLEQIIKKRKLKF